MNLKKKRLSSSSSHKEKQMILMTSKMISLALSIFSFHTERGWNQVHAPARGGVRNCSSFLIKRDKQTYSTWPNSGLIHRKTAGMEPAADSKGVVSVKKQKAGQGKPATSYAWPAVNKNAQASLRGIWLRIHKNEYQLDPPVAATHRASTNPCNHKPVIVKRKQTRPI